MASNNLSPRAGAPRWKVEWRQPGVKERQVVLFDNEPRGDQFAAIVTALGEQWPTNQQLIALGFDALCGRQPGAVKPTAPLLPIRPSAPDTTFHQFATFYLEEELFPTGSVCGKERTQYRNRLRKHVAPYFGQRPIAVITPRELIRWQSSLFNENGGPLSAKSIANVRGTVVTPVFGAACRQGLDGEPALMLSNPMLSVPPLHGASRQIEVILTPTEAAIFLDALYTVGDKDFFDLVVCMFALGLRWGEMAGLPVRAVHQELGHVQIIQALTEDESGDWYIKHYPKTPAGFRMVPYGVEIADILTERCAGRWGDPDAIVFTGRVHRGRLGPFWIKSTFQNYWYATIRVAREMGLHRAITPHGLRHSMLTVLARANVDGKTLQSVAGHKDFKFTYQRYIHQVPNGHDDVRAAAAPMLASVTELRAKARRAA